MQSTALSARKFFEDATLSKEKFPVVVPIETRKGKAAHVALAVVNPVSADPEDDYIPYDVELFDPHGETWGVGFADPAYNVLSSNLQGDLRRSNVPLQGSLGKMHLGWDKYGMCAYLSAAVLNKAIENRSAGKPLSMQAAANDILNMVRKDPARAKKLDYWMIGSMANASAQSTRTILELGPPANQGKQARLNLAKTQAKRRRVAKSNPQKAQV